MNEKVNFGEQLVSPEEKTRKVGEVFTFEGRAVSVVEDLGDEVMVVSGLSRVTAPKSSLVLESRL